MSISYNKCSSNPFGEEEEDDWGFGKRGGPAKDPFLEEADDWDRPMSAAERLQMQKDRSMNNQLASTQRALASIYDSERTGVATAEELVRQGEQLDNVERKTHAINQDMKQTQKSLNSIKSVFGSFKNWLGRKNEEPKEEFTPPPKSSTLRDTVDAQQSMGEHPALRNRTEDFGGFYTDNNDFGGGSSGGAGGAGGYGQSSRGYSSSGYGGGTSQTQRTDMSAYDDQMETNLSMMSDGLSRLKQLGLGLEQEITDQNAQLDRIDTQIDRADVNIRNQNDQMKVILGQKKK